MKSNILIHQQQRVVPKTVGKNNKEGSPFPLDRKNNVMSILHTERVFYSVYLLPGIHTYKKYNKDANARVMMIRMSMYNKYNSTTTTHND